MTAIREFEVTDSGLTENRIFISTHRIVVYVKRALVVVVAVARTQLARVGQRRTCRARAC
eukprot:COSAG06_NODE_67255_length_252_cov_0.869281_1_plen_59_part_10